MAPDPTLSRACSTSVAGRSSTSRGLGLPPACLPTTLRNSRPSMVTAAGPGRLHRVLAVPHDPRSPTRWPARSPSSASWPTPPGTAGPAVPSPTRPLLRKAPRGSPRTCCTRSRSATHRPERHQRQHHPGRRPVRPHDVLPQRPDADLGHQPARLPRRPDRLRRQMGQLQMTTFLATGQRIDPDGPAPVFETRSPTPTTCSACTTRTRRPVRRRSRPQRPASARPGRRTRCWRPQTGPLRARVPLQGARRRRRLRLR
jgi:hypothetical protein